MQKSLNHIQKLTQSQHFATYSQQYTLSLLNQQRLRYLQRLAIKTSYLKLTDFVKFNLQLIKIKDQQRIFLTRGLIKIFQSICKSRNKDHISFLDLMGYIIQRVPRIQNQMHQKLLPFNFQISQQMRLKIPAPQLYGKNGNQMRRLEQKVIYQDKVRHEGRIVQRVRYSQSCDRYFMLESPSQYISQYDGKCELIRKIKCSIQLAKKQSFILSFDWSQNQKRLGCVLLNNSCSFWSFVDQYRFQVNVPVNRKYLKTPPTSIYFMKSQLKWLTFDSKPNIYILSQNDFTVQDYFHHPKLDCKDKGFLITEAGYQKVLCIAFQKNLLLVSINRKEILSQISNLKTQIRALCFSERYQALFISCFEPYISVYQLSQFCDLNQKGHYNTTKTLITALEIINQSTILISVQEDGLIRLWDIRDMSCLQWMQAPKNSIYHQILSIQDGVCLVSSKLLTYNFESKAVFKDKQYIVGIRYYHNKIVIITTKNINLYDIQTGKLQKVLTAIFEDDIIIQASVIQSKNQLLLISSKGLVKIIQIGDGTLVSKIQLRQENLVCMKYETQVKMICYATQRQIQIYQFTSKDILQKKRSIFGHDQKIQLTKTSCLHDLIAFAYQGNIIYFYTFERVKPLGSILLDSKIKDLTFIKNVRAFVVITQNQQIKLIEYQITDNKIFFIERCKLSKIWILQTTSNKIPQQQINEKQKNQRQIEKKRQLLLNKCKAQQIWTHNFNIYVSSFEGMLLIAKIQEPQNLPILQAQIDKQYYNANRTGEQNHQQAFKRIKHVIPIKNHNMSMSRKAIQKIHKLQINDLCVIDDQIITSQKQGRVKLSYFNSSGILDLGGIINIRHSLPENWARGEDKLTKIRELQFSQELLRVLRYNNPHLKQYLSTGNDIQIMNTNSKISSQKFEYKLVSKQQQDNSPSKALHSLRSKKIGIEKDRQQKKNMQNYMSLLKKQNKKQNAKNTNEEHRQIILFFDQKYTENITYKNITQNSQLPANLKQLASKIGIKSQIDPIINTTTHLKTSPLRKSDFKKQEIQKLRKKSDYFPDILLAVDTKTDLKKSLVRMRQQRELQKTRVKQLVKNLGQTLMDSKYVSNRRSLSLPKLRSTKVTSNNQN